MASGSLYPTAGRYVVTEAGHAALEDDEICECVRIVTQGFLACPECGTVYAILRQQTFLGARDAK